MLDLEGDPQGLADPLGGLELLVHLDRVHPHRVAAGVLGPVHGHVGLSQQVGRIDGVGPGQRDAHAHADPVRASLDAHGLVEGRPHTLGDCAHVLGLGQLRAEHHELVAADPGQGVLGAHGCPDAPRHGHQQLVAHLVPTRVVDHLEAVEVQEDHGHVRTAGLLVQGRQLPQELAAIDQPGQGVLARLAVQSRAGGPLLGDVVEDHQREGLTCRVDLRQRRDRDRHPAIGDVVRALTPGPPGPVRGRPGRCARR